MNPIIHIGFPKTGTTWLQEEFFPKVEHVDFISRNEVSEHIVKPNSFEIDYELIKKHFESKGDKRIIISDEMFVGGLDAGFINGVFIKEIAHRLKQIFHDATIIIFVRNQQSLIASAYFQYVRVGGNYSVEKYLKRDKLFKIFLNELSLFSFDFFKFDQIISYYKNLFGANNVDVYLYEDFKANPKSFLETFVKKYNLDVDLDKIDTKIKQNSRYRIALFKLAKFTNCFTFLNTSFKYYLFNIPKLYYISHSFYKKLNRFKIFGNAMSDKKLLGQKNINFINEFYKESNANLIKEHGLVDIKKYNYPL